MGIYIQFVKYSVKNIVAYFLYYTGVLFYLKNKKLSDKLIVLTYHRILPMEKIDESFSNTGIIVKPETFDKHLDFLQKQFKITTIDSFYSIINSGKTSSSPSCLITFDDGWVDNYLYGFPILKKNNLPATIFLPTGYMENNDLFWQEKLCRLIYMLVSKNAKEANNLLANHGVEIENITPSLLKVEIKECVNKLKSRPYKDIDNLIQEISKILEYTGSETHIDQYMNWNHIREMSKYNISFESHAHSHKILTRLEKDAVKDELLKSAEIIGRELDKKVKYIAYPNGDSDSEIQELAQANGYLLGFGTKRGINSSSSNLYDIKRINIHENKAGNTPLLMMSILGYY